MHKWAMLALCSLAIVLGVTALLIEVNNHSKEYAAEREAENAPIDDTPVDPEAAESIYKASCLSCHGVDLEGGVGPALNSIGSELDRREIHNVIMNGQGNMMPAFRSSLSDEEISNLAGWLAEMQ
ncbi:c-type cytochrome [Paenibacillus senegalensis]|uniref:c-type cytochrome n=1 Tax=Paenibacillus senegalensis TaxID=1465766 RepID=UPI00028982FA|nr:cytochrome c [Paenibacillus senegalensis]